MKTIVQLLISSLVVSSSIAAADPGIMFGISYNFGGSVGFTAKAMSDNEENEMAAVAGVSYFPWEKSNRLGVDVGAGYVVAPNTVITGGWDFMANKIQFSTGYMNTDNGESNSPVVLPVKKAPQPPPNPV